jgi:hypothetical protein
MTDPGSNAELARTIADKLAGGGGVPAHVHAATGQIYALLAVVERLDAIVARLDRLDTVVPRPAVQMLAESAGTSAGSIGAPIEGSSVRQDSPTV